MNSFSNSICYLAIKCVKTERFFSLCDKLIKLPLDALQVLLVHSIFLSTLSKTQLYECLAHPCRTECHSPGTYWCKERWRGLAKLQKTGRGPVSLSGTYMGRGLQHTLTHKYTHIWEWSRWEKRSISPHLFANSFQHHGSSWPGPHTHSRTHRNNYALQTMSG